LEHPMNERFRELSDIAYKNHLERNPHSSFGRRSDYDKEFAELIVGEFYETIKKDMELAHIQLIPIDFGIYANGRLRRIIKEHFGVKE
jgi:hypothetical protein